MRILYLCPDLGIPVLGRKGASVHVRELVAAFTRAGHDVVLAAQMLNKSPWEKPAEKEIPLIHVRPGPAASAAVLALKEFNELLGTENSLPGELRRILFNKEFETELKRRFENHPPDFIYERASLYATAGVGLARALDRPLILELNAPLAVEQSTYRATGLGQLAAESERWTLLHAQAIIVVSSLLREHVLSLGVPSDRVHVLPNGVDPALFHPSVARHCDSRAELGDPRAVGFWPPGELNGASLLGFVGNLRPWHGVEVLPALLERLVGSGHDVRLIVAGDGPLRKDLEREFTRRNLDSRALITGLVPHEEVPALIRRFDIALAPYGKADHPFYFSPLKVFEYMACGAAVVAPGMGQLAEVLRDGQNALLYPPGDLDAMIDCCKRLLREPDLRRQLGQAAATEVHARYTWDQNARRVIELVRALKTPPVGDPETSRAIPVQP